MDRDIMNMYWKHMRELAYLKMFDRLNTFVLAAVNADLDVVLTILLGSKPYAKLLPSRSVLLEDDRITSDLREIL